MISDGSEDRHHLRVPGPERRGRSPVVFNYHMEEMHRIIREERPEARKLTWEQLAWEVGLKGVSDRTIVRVAGDTVEYMMCVAC